MKKHKINSKHENKNKYVNLVVVTMLHLLQAMLWIVYCIEKFFKGNWGMTQSEVLATNDTSWYDGDGE